MRTCWCLFEGVAGRGNEGEVVSTAVAGIRYLGSSQATVYHASKVRAGTVQGTYHGEAVTQRDGNTVVGRRVAHVPSCSKVFGICLMAASLTQLHFRGGTRGPVG